MLTNFRAGLNEEDQLALENEIEILKTVDHPNIVKLFDIFEDEENYFLIMELMTGGEVSLTTWVNICLKILAF